MGSIHEIKNAKNLVINSRFFLNSIYFFTKVQFFVTFILGLDQIGLGMDLHIIIINNNIYNYDYS